VHAIYYITNNLRPYLIMRAFVLVALLGVAYGNLCSGVSKDSLKGVLAAGSAGASYFLGDLCPSFDFESVLLSGECRALVRQGACYGIRASTYYSGVPTYAQLAADVPNFAALGNLACKKAAGCFDQLRAAFDGCVAGNANFVQDAVARAEFLYNQDLASTVNDFAAQNSGSLVGDLLGMALNQFSSAQDIEDFLNMHITEGISSDAAAAAEEALAIARQWCASKCTDKSAKFLAGIFSHMQGGSCSLANEFCGECADRADSWFTNNQLPCCVESVVQKGIQAYNYVLENYGAAISDAAAVVEAGLSDAAIAEAQAIGARLRSEFNCVATVYQDNQPDCA